MIGTSVGASMNMFDSASMIYANAFPQIQPERRVPFM